jgi:hypothetical protein
MINTSQDKFKIRCSTLDLTEVMAPSSNILKTDKNISVIAKLARKKHSHIKIMLIDDDFKHC